MEEAILRVVGLGPSLERQPRGRVRRAVRSDPRQRIHIRAGPLGQDRQDRQRLHERRGERRQRPEGVPGSPALRQSLLGDEERPVAAAADGEAASQELTSGHSRLDQLKARVEGAKCAPVPTVPQKRTHVLPPIHPGAAGLATLEIKRPDATPGVRRWQSRPRKGAARRTWASGAARHRAAACGNAGAAARILDREGASPGGTALSATTDGARGPDWTRDGAG